MVRANICELYHEYSVSIKFQKPLDEQKNDELLKRDYVPWTRSVLQKKREQCVNTM